MKNKPYNTVKKSVGFDRSLIQALRRVWAHAATTTSCLLVMLICSSVSMQASVRTGPGRYKQQEPEFTILSPAFGSSQNGAVNVKVKYTTRNEIPTVKVRLNGKTIKGRRFTTSCRGGTCSITGTLDLADGLRVGENQLSATLVGRLHPSDSSTSRSTPVLVERTKFQYNDGLMSGQGNSVAYYTPVSIGLSTIPGGGGAAGGAWLQLTTGYPADWNTVADAYAFPGLTDGTNSIPTTIPYPDVSEGFACYGTFQAYVLGRQNPYLAGPNDEYVETGACVNSISDLQTAFQGKFNRPLGSQDLVIVGTTPGQTVPAGFDSSFLGGTNYSNVPSGEYPQAYVMIGVPGAAPGTAHEVFNTVSAANRPNTGYLPALNGTLMLDQYNNYNFVPSGNVSFEVHSDPLNGGAYIKVGDKTYTPPDFDNDNFWLLVIDQETLTPVNYYPSADTSKNCDSGSTSQSCGAMYTVAADGGNNLAAAISGLAHAHDLIFLATQGCPVDPNTTPSELKSGLANALKSIGGAPYALEYQGGPTTQNFCLYSLVTVNDGKHTHPLTDPVALSSGAFSSNLQNGSLQGYLARNLQGVYDVATKTQMVPDNDGNLTSPIDNTFTIVASSQRQDWPLIDTAFPIEAYADLSYQIVHALGQSSPHMYDLRFFYTDSGFMTDTLLSDIMFERVADDASQPFTKTSWDNASDEQFAAARHQIYAEYNQAQYSYTFLNQVRNLLAGSDGTIYSDMINAANKISNDYGVTQTANANARLSGDLALAGSVVGLGSVIPDIGPLFGIASGALTIGSTAVALNSTDPPSPEAIFDTTLGDLTENSEKYTSNLTLGFNGEVDNIMSDVGKLSTIGGLTLSHATGWSFNNQMTANNIQPLVDGAERSMWLDILPQLYGMRYVYEGGPSPYAKDYGADETGNGGCVSTYKGIDPAVYSSYLWISNPYKVTWYDVYVFAENPKPQSHDAAVSADLASHLITTGTQTKINPNTKKSDDLTNLNLPSMLLYAYSDMTYSMMPGPYGQGDSAGYCRVK